MDDTELLEGKKILVVDDEPDILETLEELLDMCSVVDTAPDYETAQKFLEKNQYDAAVLDIMGVRGYDLLDLANKKGIPALMLTAHALTPDNLVKSIKAGAQSYVPKDKISDITIYLADIIRTTGPEDKSKKKPMWFKRLKPVFDEKFGKDWYKFSKDELEKIL